MSKKDSVILSIPRLLYASNACSVGNRVLSEVQRCKRRCLDGFLCVRRLNIPMELTLLFEDDLCGQGLHP